MFEVLKESSGDLLAVRVSGKFTDEDFDKYRQLTRERVMQFGSVRLYFEMKDYEGWELSSFLENALFDVLHGREYNRVAMVGETDWQHWAARVASPIKKKGVKYFDLKDKGTALLWLDEDPDAKLPLRREQ